MSSTDSHLPFTLLSQINNHYSSKKLVPVSSQTHKLSFSMSAPSSSEIFFNQLILTIVENTSSFVITIYLQLKHLLCLHTQKMNKIINQINTESFTTLKLFFQPSTYTLGANISLFKYISFNQPLQAWNQYIVNSLKGLDAGLQAMMGKIIKEIKSENNKRSEQQKKQDAPKQRNEEQNKEKTDPEIILRNFRKIIDKLTQSKRKSSKKHLKIKPTTTEANLFSQTKQDQKKLNLKYYEKYLKKHSQLPQNDKSLKLIQIIRLQKVISRTKLNENNSNFSEIHRLIADYVIIQGSIYSHSNQLIQRQTPREEKKEIQSLKNSCVIEKTPLDGVPCPSFSTQIQIIRFLRNSSCDSIAEYYFEQILQVGQKDHIKSFFIKYYQKELFSQTYNPKKKLHLLLLICLGIQFLRTKGIVHRDLKPENILLNEKSIPKIIDFGSAAASFQSRLKLPISTNLRTTRGYNLTYSQIQTQIKSIVNIDQFQMHENFDIYAFGMIMKFLIDDREAKNLFGLVVYENLVWLQQKCVEENPFDRIPSSEAFGFIKYIWSCVRNCTL